MLLSPFHEIGNELKHGTIDENADIKLYLIIRCFSRYTYILVKHLLDKCNLQVKKYLYTVYIEYITCTLVYDV